MSDSGFCKEGGREAEAEKVRNCCDVEISEILFILTARRLRWTFGRLRRADKSFEGSAARNFLKRQARHGVRKRCEFVIDTVNGAVGRLYLLYVS